MRIKITKTRKIIESWIEKNGKIVEIFPSREMEYIEKEIEQGSFRVPFKDKTVVEVSFPENKISYCSECKKEKRIVSSMNYTKDGWKIDGLNNLSYCLDCSLKKIGGWNDYLLDGSEVLNEVKEEMNYREKLHNYRIDEYEQTTTEN